MKFLSFTLLSFLLFFGTFVTNAQTGTLLDPFVIDMSTSPQTITNINTQNATETIAGATAPSCVGTIACCSVLVYKVILPTAGSIVIDTDNFISTAGSIFAYTSAVATPTGWADMHHFNSLGNDCTERDSMKLGRGYQRHGIPPYWFDEATFDDANVNVNYYVPAGDYYIAHWNYDQETPEGTPTNLTFTFTPYCQPVQPEIEVEGNSIAIALGDNTPSTGDGTDFGIVIGSPATKTFTIKNVSVNQLDILNVNISGDNAANFSVTASPSATVAGNSTTTFTVQFTPNTIGVNNATISIGNTDCDKYGYKFDVTATALGVAPSDKRGDMITLDGSNDYVEINSVAEKMVGVTSFTFETWVNADASQSGNDQMIAVNKVNGDNRILFYLDDGVLETFVASSGNTYENNALYSDLGDGLWHHVAFTHDGSTNINSVYLDGQLVETQTRAVTDFLATDLWSIGQEYDNGSGSSTPTSDFFKGKFDEVRIWKDVRTEDEIRNYKNVTFTTDQIKAYTNLVAYYQFDNDEATGTADGVKDILGNHGTVKNGGVYSASEVAVGSGTTEKQSVTASGFYSFSTVGVTLRFITSGGESFPDDDVAITKITTEAPNTAATGKLANEPTTYWIINNYGTNTNLNADVTFKFDDGAIADAVIGNHKMHKRGSNEFAAGDWVDLTPTSVGATAGDNHIKVNVTSFSQFSASSSSSDFVANLPVELISFNGYATTKGSRLTWQTAMEKNNEGFEIQRSFNGRDWENIGFVIGKGTTQENQDYQFMDEQPRDGVNYYRLKQIDFDGRSDYSTIVNVEHESAQSKLRIFPNPIKDELNIISGQGNATIYNILGQPVKQLVIKNEQSKINASDLASGQYILHIQQPNGQVITKRFMK
jgi:hypothetical protein